MRDYHLLLRGDHARANRWLPFAVGLLSSLHLQRYASGGASLTRVHRPEPGITIRVDTTTGINKIYIVAEGTPWFICEYRVTGTGNGAEYDIFFYSPERQELRRAFQLDVSDYSWLTSGNAFLAPNRVTYFKKIIDFEAFDTTLSFNFSTGRFEKTEAPDYYDDSFTTPRDSTFIIDGTVSAQHATDAADGGLLETGTSLRLYPTLSTWEGVICSVHYRDSAGEGTIGMAALLDDWEGNYYYVGQRFTAVDDAGDPVTDQTKFDLLAYLNDPAKTPSGNWGYFAGLRPVPMVTADSIYFALADNTNKASGYLDLGLFEYDLTDDTVTKLKSDEIYESSATKPADTVDPPTTFLEGLDTLTIGYATSVMEIDTGTAGSEPCYNDYVKLYAGPLNDLEDDDGNVVRAGGMANVELIHTYDVRALLTNAAAHLEMHSDQTLVPEMVVENFWVVDGRWQVDANGDPEDKTIYGVHLIHQHPLDSSYAGLIGRYSADDGFEVLYYTGYRGEAGRTRSIVNLTFFGQWAVFREVVSGSPRDMRIDMKGPTWDFDDDSNASLAAVRDATFYDEAGEEIESYTSAEETATFLPAFIGEIGDA